MGTSFTSFSPWYITGSSVQSEIFAGNMPICTLPKMDSQIPDGHSKEEIDANARLIAAAPELLEELKLIVDCWIKRGTHGTERLTIWEKERLHYMKEVITKAEGN